MYPHWVAKISSHNFSISKMSVTSNTIGKDAIVSVLLPILHPLQLVQTTFPSCMNDQRLEGCVILRQEEKKINQKMQTAIIIHHKAFKAGGEFVEVNAAKQWFKLQVQGPQELLFQPEELSDLDTIMEDEEEGPEMLDIILQTRHGTKICLQNFCHLGSCVWTSQCPSG